MSGVDSSQDGTLVIEEERAAEEDEVPMNDEVEEVPMNDEADEVPMNDEADEVPMNDEVGHEVKENGAAPKEDEEEDGGSIEIEVPPMPPKIEERLIITKIINTNFKSYAGTQVLGPFHKNFSCIIGPNGSGKSNVIDSMLFVFGYRSSKIRSKKLSVLIHNSAGHPNISSCTVEVCFQRIKDIDDDNFEFIPGTDFSISRTATKSNTSSYQISGRKSDYKEVTALLKQSGIDLDHNRFLILQGEVEQISLMKPKAPTEHEDGMLEYLEDIIGTSTYKQPIEELAKTVEDLNEQRGEKLNRVKAAEKEKNALEGPKNEACEFIKLDNELTSKKHLLSQTFVQGCKKVIAEVETKKAKEEEVMSEVLGEVKTVVDSKMAKEGELKTEKRTLDKIVKAGEKAENEFKEFEKRDLKVREDLKHNKAKMKKLLAKVGDEKKKLTKLIDLPAKSEEELEEFNDRLRVLEQDKVTKEQELQEIKEEIKPKIKKINEDKDLLASDMMEIKKGVNQWQSKVNISQSELDLLTSEKTKKEKQLEEARASLEKVNVTYKEETGTIKGLLKTIPEAETALHNQQNKLDSVIRTEKEVSVRLNDVKGKFVEAKSALAATTSRGRVLEGLLREKKAGRLPGLCGRLGDLGTIDDKYDVAVSTACSALNNIVCEDFETAQKCVEYIRSNDLGTATFIALDKMQANAQKAQQPITVPAGALRLYDLIKQKDSKYSGAFYHALRDTLVAADTESAKRIAYDKAQRWRVVTFSGVIIDVSGTMSGGGNRVIKGLLSKVSCDIDPKEVDRMSERINVDQKEIEGLREQKVGLETEVRGLQKKISADKFTRQKAEQAIKSYLKQQTSLQKEIPVLEQQLKTIVPDEGKVEEIRERIREQTTHLDKILKEAAEKDGQIKKLDQKIADINEKQLKPCQEAVKSTEQEIDKIHDKITKINVALKSLERNKTKVEQFIVDYEQELSESQQFTEELKKEFTVIEEMAEEVIERNETCKSEMVKQKEKLGILQKELAILEKDLVEHEKKTVDYKHAIEAFDGIIKENNAKMRHWKKEMSRMSLQHIPGEPEPVPLPVLEEEALEEVDNKNLEYEITVLEETLRQKEPNMSAIKEYMIKHTAWEEKVAELDSITTNRDMAREEHEGLRKKRLQEFMTGFLIITNKLKEMYQMITLGGDAELELVDTLDPFSEGIVFSVRPPKKSWKNISNLSGGEKTLSSLALVFALHHYKPSPLYVMDEIDAALDFKNVSIVAHYIKERTKNAQFIIISLRNNMFELGDQLIGIYKTQDCTKSVTINPSAITTGC